MVSSTLQVTVSPPPISSSAQEERRGIALSSCTRGVLALIALAGIGLVVGGALGRAHVHTFKSISPQTASGMILLGVIVLGGSALITLYLEGLAPNKKLYE